MGGVKYIHKTKDIFLHCTNAGTMSSGPSQGPAHTGTAGLSQPTGTCTPPQGRGPLPTGARLKPGITATDKTGTGTLRPHRFPIQWCLAPSTPSDPQSCRTAPKCSDWSENSGLDELEFGGKRKIRRQASLYS